VRVSYYQIHSARGLALVKMKIRMLVPEDSLDSIREAFRVASGRVLHTWRGSAGGDKGGTSGVLVYNCKAVVIQEERRRVFDVSVVG